jgi:hypothetical protein
MFGALGKTPVDGNISSCADTPEIIIDKLAVQLILTECSFNTNQLNIYFLSRATEGLAL